MKYNTTLSSAKSALKKWKEEMKSPSSDTYKKHQEYLQRLSEQRLEREEKVALLDKEINSYPSFKDFMQAYKKERQSFLDEEFKKGNYVESWSKDFLLYELMQKKGSEMHPELFDKLQDEFSSTAYHYKGYIFGVAHGQGSYAWSIEWDVDVLGPEQKDIPSLSKVCKYILDIVKDVSHQPTSFNVDLSSLEVDHLFLNEYIIEDLTHLLLSNSIGISSLEKISKQLYTITVYKKYTTSQIVDKITDFERDAGESFTDYFMHDSVYAGSWAFWLIGKGFESKGNSLILKIMQGQDYFDQEELFDVFNTEFISPDNSREWDEAYFKNKKLWAEFLTSNPKYSVLVHEFFTEKNK